MYLQSNLNPLLKSEGSVPVAIFSLSDEQMFLHVSETYQVSDLFFFFFVICEVVFNYIF